MTSAPDVLHTFSLETLKAVLSGALLVVAVGLGSATLLRASPPQRRTDDLMQQVGKSTAGRLLDGVEHNGFPEARA